MCLANKHTLFPAAVGPPVTAAPSNTCPKCGTVKKTKQLSCCAPGGAWVNKCGNTGNQNFDHTWSDGIRSCSFAAQARPQIMLRHETTQSQSNTTGEHDGPQENIIDPTGNSDFTFVDTTNSEGWNLSKIVSFTSLLLTVLHLNV